MSEPGGLEGEMTFTFAQVNSFVNKAVEKKHAELVEAVRERNDYLAGVQRICRGWIHRCENAERERDELKRQIEAMR